jgi:hypothetical protein
MLIYQYAGLPTAIADQARATHLSPQYGHPAHRERARGTGPCRHCLRLFQVGEEDRLLFTYQPFSEEGCLPDPGPIFVHADGCTRYDAPTFPPDFRHLPIVVEGYGGFGRLRFQVRVQGEDPEAVIARAFAYADVGYVHLRNGEAGCFMARVDRTQAASSNAV